MNDYLSDMLNMASEATKITDGLQAQNVTDNDAAENFLVYQLEKGKASDGSEVKVLKPIKGLLQQVERAKNPNKFTYIRVAGKTSLFVGAKGGKLEENPSVPVFVQDVSGRRERLDPSRIVHIDRREFTALLAKIQQLVLNRLPKPEKAEEKPKAEQKEPVSQGFVEGPFDEPPLKRRVQKVNNHTNINVTNLVISAAEESLRRQRAAHEREKRDTEEIDRVKDSEESRQLAKKARQTPSKAAEFQQADQLAANSHPNMTKRADSQNSPKIHADDSPKQPAPVVSKSKLKGRVAASEPPQYTTKQADSQNSPKIHAEDSPKQPAPVVPKSKLKGRVAASEPPQSQSPQKESPPDKRAA